MKQMNNVTKVKLNLSVYHKDIDRVTKEHFKEASKRCDEFVLALKDERYLIIDNMKAVIHSSIIRVVVVLTIPIKGYGGFDLNTIPSNWDFFDIHRDNNNNVTIKFRYILNS